MKTNILLELKRINFFLKKQVCGTKLLNLSNVYHYLLKFKDVNVIFPI